MQHTKRNNIVIALTVIVCLVICVLWATVFFLRRVQQANENASSIDESSDFSDTAPVIPDPIEALLACDETVAGAPSFQSQTQGYCNSQIMFFNFKYDLLSERYINGDEIVCRDFAYGSHIRYGLSRYISSEARLVQSGIVRSFKDVAWEEKPVSLTAEAYNDAFGTEGRALSSFILSEDTILSARLKEYTDETVTFVYELNAKTATQNQIKKIKTLCALEEAPVMQSLKMTVVMDYFFYPISVTYEEVYFVSLPLVGKTTCKSVYTESFSDFDRETTIPDRDFYKSFLSLKEVNVCPTVSAGYQLLLSFFEDRSVYEVEITLNSTEIPLELSTDIALGAIYLQNDDLAFLYQNDRYHFSYRDINLYTEAEVLNQYLLPLFSSDAVSPLAFGKEADPLSGIEFKTENGMLILTSETDSVSFEIVIDSETMSLMRADFALTEATAPCIIHISKTNKSMNIPQNVLYQDISESVSAISFVTSMMDGNNHLYRLETDGSIQYSADLILSTKRGLSLSVKSSSDQLPLDLYFDGTTIHSVMGDASIAGTVEDYIILLSSFFDNGVSTVSEQGAPVISDIVFEKDRISIVFGEHNGFSVTISPERVSASAKGIRAEIMHLGVSISDPLGAPTVSNMLDAKTLGMFIHDSVYPSLLGADGIGALLRVDIGDEVIDGDLKLNVSSDFACLFETTLFGMNADLIYNNGVVFLSTSAFDGYINVFDLPSILGQFSDVAKDPSTIPLQVRDTSDFSVTCDGESVLIVYNGLNVALYKQSIYIENDEISIRATDLHSSDIAIINTPNEKDCIDLKLLTERVSAVASQSKFSFVGELRSNFLTSDITRFDFVLNHEFKLAPLAIEILPNGLSDAIKLFFDGDAFYLQAGNTKLFCLEDALMESIASISAPQTASYDIDDNWSETGLLRSVSFKNDLLIIKTDAFVLSILITDDGLEAIELDSDTAKLRLEKANFTEILLPSLDGYVDVTSATGLIPMLYNSISAGNFEFEGSFDLDIGNLSVKGVALLGTIDFSSGDFKGYFCTEIPYLYGLTSQGIALKQGNALLQSCMIKSDIYVLGDQIFVRRTITAVYGDMQPIKLVYIEKRAVSVIEFLLSPETLLSFAMNIDEDLLSSDVGSISAFETKKSAKPNPVKRFVYTDGKYLLELDPAALELSVGRLALFAQTDGQYISTLGVETSVSAFDLRISCVLSGHGVSFLAFENDDFLSYKPLQD